MLCVREREREVCMCVWEECSTASVWTEAMRISQKRKRKERFPALHTTAHTHLMLGTAEVPVAMVIL